MNTPCAHQLVLQQVCHRTHPVHNCTFRHIAHMFILQMNFLIFTSTG